MSRPKPLLVLLVLLIFITVPIAASKRKRKQRRRVAVPTVPSEYHEDGRCPYHRAAADATPKDLSEYGHELERDGRQPEALRCYAAAIRAHPNDAAAWFDLAIARQHEEPAAAMRFYRHGMTLAPAASSAFHHNQLGVMLRVAERHEEAAGAFTRAARLAPADADPLFNLGGTQDTRQRYRESLHAYRGALDLDRKNEARIQNNIGNVLGKLNDWRSALVAYQEALEADPDFPETQQNLGHVFGELERYDEADKHLMAAARLLPAEAANITKQREELSAKAVERAKRKRQAARRDEINKRDGHLTKEQRVERMQQVIGHCGMDKECIKQALGQEDAKEGDLLVF